MTMKALVLVGFVTMSIATNALAQGLPPKVGGKPVAQVKPKAITGCKLVGTVKGTRIWAGDCTVASEMRGSAPAAEATPSPSLPAQAAGAISPGEKQ
jgi:hypothetical protein